MQRVNTMHAASGTPAGEGQVELSPMDAQLARVVAHLAQTNPNALPAVWSALGMSVTSQDVPGGSGVVSTSNSSTMSAAPGNLAQVTPAPAGPNGSFYTEGTLLNANNSVRADSARRGDLQSASNIRAGWTAARGRKKSAFGRGTPNTPSVSEPRLAEAPQAVEKAVPARLSKDHDVPLKNQPPGGVMYVPAARILSDGAPWTEIKLEALRKLCRKLELVGYPVFTYGMAAEDVRKELEKSLPAIEFIEAEEYVWILASEDSKELYNGPRSTVTGGRHLDRFYEDGGLSIVAPMWPSFVIMNAAIHKRFQREWEDILDDINKPRGCKTTLKAHKTRRASSGEVAASPANAQQALRGRLSITARSGTAAALAPVDEEAVAAASPPSWGSLGRPLALSDTSAEEDNVPSNNDTITAPLLQERAIRLETPSARSPGATGEASTPTSRPSVTMPITYQIAIALHSKPLHHKRVTMTRVLPRLAVSGTYRRGWVTTLPVVTPRKTPKLKRTRIEWSPLFSSQRKNVPRLTRNSVRAGMLDNAADAVI